MKKTKNVVRCYYPYSTFPLFLSRWLLFSFKSHQNFSMFNQWTVTSQDFFCPWWTSIQNRGCFLLWGGGKRRPRSLLICLIIIRYGMLSRDYKYKKKKYIRINQWWRLFSLVLYYTRRLLTSNVYMLCLPIMLLCKHIVEHHSKAIYDKCLPCTYVCVCISIYKNE